LNQGSSDQGSAATGSTGGRASAYYDLGVPAQRPAGIAGGIANGQVGSIGGEVANGPNPGAVGGQFDGGVSSLGGDIGQADGLDFSVDYPPDESGVANTGEASAATDAGTTTNGTSGGATNTQFGASQAAAFPPDLGESTTDSTAGSGRFNGRTAAGMRRLNRNNANQPARSRLQQRFGDEF